MDLRTTATNIRIARSTVTTTCSGCSARTTVDVEDGVASVRVPSNGRHGSLHVAAHVAVADVMLSGGLLLWDCPACGYAESFEWEA